MEVVIVIWIVSALIGAVIGQAKGRAGAGFALGLILGVIGILITALLSPTPEKQAERLGMIRAALGTAQAGASAAWWPDPHKRHDLRYRDGFRWTEHVADSGVQSTERP